MSRIVVCIDLSVNGYMEGADGDVTVMPMDDAFGQHNADRVRSAGRLLFGATTYRGMAGFWPALVDDPEAAPSDRYIAARYAAGIPITVVSDSLDPGDLTVWAEQTTIVRRADAHDAVRRLRDQDDEADVLIFGSWTLWNNLLTHRLLDELYLMIGPKIVAGDRPAFAGIPTTDLRLLDVRSWQGSGNVVLHYAVDTGNRDTPPAWVGGHRQ